MTPLVHLSEFARSCFSLWAFAICLIGIFSAVRAAAQRRYRFAGLTTIPFACGYFIWQILFDLHLFAVKGGAVGVSTKLGALPWAVWLLVLCVLTSVSLLLFVSIVRYGKNSVTPNAVKYFLDRMPCGVCLWNGEGRILFSNVCMERLCLAVTGSVLLDGNAFFEALKEEILPVGEKRWRFTCRDVVFDGERLHEMIASDVTAECARIESLEKDQAELSRLNEELKEYSAGIDETVRRQEILQAKVNIHAEMNRLILSTMAIEPDNTEALDRVFTLWGQNALLLCMEADGFAGAGAAARIEDLAGALKIELQWEGGIPGALSEKQRSLFFSAAQEALSNAAKHAQAKKLTISFTDTKEAILCRFTNDGRVASGSVIFTGGLKTLALLADKQGATVTVEAGEVFTLTLIFVKNQPNG